MKGLRLDTTSLQLRFLLFVLTPLGCFLALFAWLGIDRLEEEMENSLQRETLVLARALRRPVAQALENRDAETIYASLESVFEIGTVYGAFIFDVEGRLLARAGRGSADLQAHQDLMRKIGSATIESSYRDFGGRAVYSAFVPLENAVGQPLGLLQINRDRDEMRGVLTRFRLDAVVFFLLLLFILMVVLLWGHHVALGRGIGALERTMLAVGRGDLTVRARERGPAVVMRLARGFNRMLEALNEARLELRERAAVESLLRQQVARNEELAYIGSLATSLGHELGGPLSVIQNQARRLERSLPAEEGEETRPRRAVSSIRAEGRRMEQTLLTLLGFKVNRLERRKVQLAELVEAAVAAARSAAERAGAEVHLHPPPSEETVWVDRVSLPLAIKNLLVNSFETGPGVEVGVSWKVVEGHAYIIVRDNGPGFAADEERDFGTPFTSTKEDRPGRGLGLAIVQQTMRLHNGLVKWHNRPEGGAEVRLVFPSRAPNGT
ncbi:MAG: sensor histidine kinase [Opitutales bacterium]